MEIVEIPVATVKVSPKHRKFSDARVRELADSILEIGLLQPIGVTNDKELVYGRHRLEAYSTLGRATIPAVIVTLDGLKSELAMIDENIQRAQLTKLQEGQALKRRKEIYEALHPETKHGGAPGKAGGGKKAKSDNLSSFAADTAAKTGKSKRTVERAVAAAQNITDEVQQVIDDTPVADNQSQLGKLAALPPEEQLEAAECMVAAASKPKAKRKKTAKKKTTKKTKADAAVLHTDAAVRDIVWSWAASKRKAVAAAILENWAIELRESA